MAMSRTATLLASVAALLIATAAVAADDVQDATRLFRQGSYPQALERVDAFLKANPRDARARFLRGLILTEQQKIGEAIRVFTALTEDYPELPEPYNNLAVLHAAQGQYDRARTALEMAIRTHPSYATAHENLGDIYAKMASQAYDKALQLDRGNATAQTKLELIRELFSGGPRTLKPTPRPETGRAPAGSTGEPAKTAAAPPAPRQDAVRLAQTETARPATVAVDAPRTAVAEASRPPTPAAKPGSTPEARPAAVAVDAPRTAVAEASRPSTPAAKPAPAAEARPAATPEAAASADSEAVIRTVEGWARAWSSNDVAAYLAHYAEDFKVPKGESRANWEAARTARIAKPRKIEVAIAAPAVSFPAPGKAEVRFQQQYRSGTLSSNSVKTLTLVKSGNRWLIQQERVGA